MEKGKAVVEQFIVTSDCSKLSSDWSKWIRALELHLVANKIDEEKRKIATLLSLGGSGIQEVYYGLAGENCEETYECVRNRLEEHFVNETNDTFERHKYRQIKQLKEDSFDKFVMKIRNQVDKCNFGMRKSEFIRDQIVEGSLYEKVREEIFKMKDCVLDDAIQIGRTHEMMLLKMEEFGKKENKYAIDQSDINVIKLRQREMAPQTNNDCFRCGRSGHFAKSFECPARNAKCNSCHQIGHFESKCRSRQGGRGSQGRYKNTYKKFKTGNLHNVEEQQKVEGQEDVGYLFCVGGDGKVSCEVGGVNITMLIDSGATSNMISKATWEHLKRNKIKLIDQHKGSDKDFFSYGQKLPIVIMGRFNAVIKCGNSKAFLEKFYVAEEGQQNLISKTTAEKLELLIVKNEISMVESSMGFQKIKDVEVQ